MRLIDADKLKSHYNWWNNEEQRLFDQIVDVQPTIGGEYIPREWLLNHNKAQPDDWFCADGERKDGDGD